VRRLNEQAPSGSESNIRLDACVPRAAVRAVRQGLWNHGPGTDGRSAVVGS